VIAMRDVHGCSSDEVCTALGISGGNQRVQLHRARASVRRELERYFSSQRLVAA
jgi:RNA polymerase sigma-70 factor (ECF subfamily)